MILNAIILVVLVILIGGGLYLINTKLNASTERNKAAMKAAADAKAEADAAEKARQQYELDRLEAERKQRQRDGYRVRVWGWNNNDGPGFQRVYANSDEAAWNIIGIPQSIKYADLHQQKGGVRVKLMDVYEDDEGRSAMYYAKWRPKDAGKVREVRSRAVMVVLWDEIFD